jgi:stage V sporulation protein G
MQITDVRIRPMENSGKMKAVASVTFDDEFVVHDIKIVEGDNGLFIAMPSKKIGEEYKDIAHPLNLETRTKISNAIFEKYNQTE